jgi:hypothetical protein
MYGKSKPKKVTVKSVKTPKGKGVTVKVAKSKAKC